MTHYYQDDWVTLYCADNLEVMPTLERHDLLLTDPPYGISFAAQPTKGQRWAGQVSQQWDNSRLDEHLVKWMIALTKDQVIWGGNYVADLLRVSRCWLSWYKPDAPPSMGNVEYAWTSWDKNSRQISQSISATNAERVGHPTQKPLRVISWCIEEAGDVSSVLDPFAGSGTTLVAAKLRNIHSTGIEREERYCEIAAKRLQQEVLNFAEVKS